MVFLTISRFISTMNYELYNVTQKFTEITETLVLR